MIRNIPPIPGVPPQLITSINDRLRQVPGEAKAAATKATAAQVQAILGSGGGGGGSGSASLTVVLSNAMGQVGVWFASALQATGGTLPYTFAIPPQSGPLPAGATAWGLPPGVTLNESTGAITGTPTAAGVYAITGIVTDAESNTANAIAQIAIAGSTGTVPASPGTITALSASDDYTDRYKDTGGAVHAIEDISVTVSQDCLVTIWYSSPQYNASLPPTQEGQYQVTTGANTIVLGAQDNAAGTVIFPPTVGTSETATVYAAVGAYDDSVDPTTLPSGTVSTCTVAVAGIPAPATTWITDCWIDQINVNAANRTFDWGGMYATLPFGNPNFKAARWTEQNGHYSTPNDPSTFVGGTYTVTVNGQTIPTAQHGGLEVHFADYDANTFVRQPGTNTVCYKLPGPWGVPDYILPDGSVNQDNVFRIKVMAASPKATTTPIGPGSKGNLNAQVFTSDTVTWEYQNSWGSAVGISTPELNGYLDIVFHLANVGQQSGGNLNPATLSGWLGINSSNRLDLSTSLGTLMTAIAGAGYSIPDTLLHDQNLLTYNAAASATKLASGAAAANVLVDSNIASTSIGKLIAGTVVFSGTIYMAGGNNGPVVALASTGVYLYSASASGGSPAVPGGANPTYTSTPYTSAPYAVVNSTGFFALSANGGPVTAVTAAGVSLYSAYNISTGTPSGYMATVTNGAVQLSAGLTVNNMTATLTAVMFQMLYGTTVAATLTTLGLLVQNGSYFTYTASTGVLIGYYAGGLPLVTASNLGTVITDMQASAPFVLIQSNSIWLKYASSGASMVLGYNSTLGIYGITLWSVDGTTSSPYATFTSSALTLVNGSTQVQITSTSLTIGNWNYSLACLISIQGGSLGGTVSISGTSGDASLNTYNGAAYLYLGPSGNPGMVQLYGATGAAYLSFNGNQILTQRQTGLGNPTGWADSTALAWAQSLYSKLSAHGLIT